MRTLMEIEELIDHDPLARRLASAQVPAPSDALRAALLARRHPARRSRRHRRGFIGGTIVLTGAVALIFATPVGADLGRAVLPGGMQQRLGLVAGAPEELSQGGSTWGGITGHAAPGGQPLPSRAGTLPPARGGSDVGQPTLSLLEAQKQVDFAIPTIKLLPAGVSFRGALVDSPQSVFLHESDSAGRMNLTLWIRRGTPVGGSAVPLSSVQYVQVGGSPAFYVRGDYEESAPGKAATWNPDADAAEITWEYGGLTYDLISGGLHLSSGDLIRIAESVA